MKRRPKKSNPTPAQLRARRAFAKMAKERARLARKKNSLFSIKKQSIRVRECKTNRFTGKEECHEREIPNPKRRRNKTVIKAKRVQVLATNPRRKRNAVALPATSSTLRQQYDSAGLRKLRDRLRTNIRNYEGLTRNLAKQLKSERDAGRAQDLRRQLAEIERLEAREVAQLDDVLRKISGVTSIRKPRRNAESWRKVRTTRLRKDRDAGDAQAIRSLASLQRSKRKAKESRRIVRKYSKKRNPGVTSKSRSNYRKFHGRPSRRTLSVLAPKGTPGSIAISGPIKSIRTRKVTLNFMKRRNPGSEVMLAEGDNGKLYIVSQGDHLPVSSQALADFGPIEEIEYIASKPHLGYPEQTEFYHKFGEETGVKPHLTTNEMGEYQISGGDYYVTERGIENPARRRARKKATIMRRSKLARRAHRR